MKKITFKNLLTSKNRLYIVYENTNIKTQFGKLGVIK